MLKASPDQVKKPAPSRRWPVVANRHRRAAMEEAKEIIELINKDFIELLKDEIEDDIIEAIMNVRRNPGKAIVHLKLAQRSLLTISRSAGLVQSRAEMILTVLESAPADDAEEDAA
jgi:hypothetical protein